MSTQSKSVSKKGSRCSTLQVRTNQNKSPVRMGSQNQVLRATRTLVMVLKRMPKANTKTKSKSKSKSKPKPKPKAKPKAK